jgi:hypothetical protein
MKNYKSIVLLAVSLVLSGCASVSGDPHPGKLERVGVLLVNNCTQRSECVPFSLLEPDMQARHVALSGNIDAALGGYLIAVLGTELPSTNGMELIDVGQTRAITEFDYQPFLAQAVSEYTQQNFQCISFWDQSYSWKLDGRQPVLMVSLSHPQGAAEGIVELHYDGLSKALMSANSSPDGANPCRLR